MKNANLTDTQRAALRLAAEHGTVIVAVPNERAIRGPNVCAGNTFAALARAGLLTHDVNGVPESTFAGWVGGTRGYLTPAGRGAL